MSGKQQVLSSGFAVWIDYGEIFPFMKVVGKIGRLKVLRGRGSSWKLLSGNCGMVLSLFCSSFSPIHVFLCFF